MFSQRDFSSLWIPYLLIMHCHYLFIYEMSTSSQISRFTDIVLITSLACYYIYNILTCVHIEDFTIFKFKLVTFDQIQLPLLHFVTAG